jgi:hypothetical protein
MTATASSSVASQADTPNVVRFGYINFKVDAASKTVSANCKKCKLSTNKIRRLLFAIFQFQHTNINVTNEYFRCKFRTVQTCQVSRISRESPAFERFLPLTRRIAKIYRITQRVGEIRVIAAGGGGNLGHPHILYLFPFGGRILMLGGASFLSY